MSHWAAAPWRVVQPVRDEACAVPEKVDILPYSIPALRRKIFLVPCRLTETEIAASQQYFVIMGPEGDASLSLIAARM
jgi:hypothetical protein